MNIDEAIAAHVAWKRRIRDYVVAPDGSLTVEEASSPSACALGQWLAVEARDLIPDDNVYAGVVLAHAGFHIAAGEVLRAALRAPDQAERLLADDQAFAQASMEVVVALRGARASARGAAARPVGARWSQDLLTGHPEVDAQHREIFHRVDALQRAAATPAGGADVPEMLTFLARYVGHHFDTEERLMAARQYPEQARHRALHRAFQARVASMKEDHRRFGDSALLGTEVLHASAAWLVQHILGEDVALASWLRGHP